MKFFKIWFPVVLYSGIIFYVSSLPNLKSPSLENFSLDKLFHGMEYLILGFLVAQALFSTKPELKFKVVLVSAFLFCTFYGFSDEFHQSFVPGRDSSRWDFLADSIGGFLGSVLNLLIKKNQIKKYPESRKVNQHDVSSSV